MDNPKTQVENTEISAMEAWVAQGMPKQSINYGVPISDNQPTGKQQHPQSVSEAINQGLIHN